MKIFLKILLLTIPFFSFGQIKLSIHPGFEIIGKDTVNRTIDQQKQGTWVYYIEGLQHISCFTSNSYYGKTIDYIKSKGTYSNGNKVGTWNLFYKSKELKQQYVYNNAGQKDGTSIEYFLNGKVKSKQVWEKDILIAQTVFFENGHKKIESKSVGGQIRSFVIYYTSGNPKFQGELFPSMKIKKLIKLETNGTTHKLEHKQFGSLMVEEGLLVYL